jgi:hypothetical protein
MERLYVLQSLQDLMIVKVWHQGRFVYAGDPED